MALATGSSTANGVSSEDLQAFTETLTAKCLSQLYSDDLERLINKCLPKLSSEEVMHVLEKCVHSLSSGNKEAASLPGLSVEQLRTLETLVGTLGRKFELKARCKTYFKDQAGMKMAETINDEDIFPSNAAALVTDGTIQVLEILQDEDSWANYDHCKVAEFVKMKVKGIEEIVELYYFSYGTKKYPGTSCISLQIGGQSLQRCIFALGYFAESYEDENKAVSNKLLVYHPKSLKKSERGGGFFFYFVFFWINFMGFFVLFAYF